MTGTRFVRTGRCRLLVCLGVLVSLMCMVAIFHSSQQQLDETREQRLRCERQQDQLNEQLQNMVEQKYKQQKTLEQERKEQMEARLNFEKKVKELTELHTNEQMDLRAHYEKLQQSHKLLKSEHNELVGECQKSKKELLESTNGLEKKLQSLRSEGEKEKNVLNAELALWREKFNAMTAENDRLKALLDASSTKSELQSRLTDLEHRLSECQQHCDYNISNQNNKNENPLNPLNTARSTSPYPRVEQSFNEQVPILPKPIEKIQEIKRNDADINSMAMLRQPHGNEHQSSSTAATKPEQHVLEAANAPVKQINSSSTTSSGGLPPLPIPPNPRKIPENVAPIPANFDQLLKDDHANRNADKPDRGDVNPAGELQRNGANDAEDGDDEANNNRYANAINDMEAKPSHKEAAVGVGAKTLNEDSGAHEIKDNDFINDPNFNLPADEDKNFFDGGGGGGDKNEMPAGGADEKAKIGDDNDDDEGLAGAVDAGDIAVKNHNLLDTNNLNNEVAGDQGRELPDELHLEENNEEDEDEDDYSNPAARQQGEQAIRH